MNHSTQREVSDWWQTSIIDMEPGEIRYRGYPVEQLIGNINFSQMIWLMLRGELPDKSQVELLDTALMSAVDHGPQAPSIAIARMAATCGVGLNNAMASAVNVLGDVHGGAGEQAMMLFYRIRDNITDGTNVQSVVEEELDEFFSRGGKFLAGYGHRFHPVDPRAPRLLELVETSASRAGNGKLIDAVFVDIARTVEDQLKVRKGKLIPLNIDGATAVIYASLGFAPPLARGLFCLSRSVGILAHAWEQDQQGGRNKGPIPRTMRWSYTGELQRSID